MIRSIFSSLILASTISLCNGQFVKHGYVLSNIDSSAIEGALVIFEGSIGLGVTDSTGYFNKTLKKNPKYIKVKSSFFEEEIIYIEDNESDFFEFFLQPKNFTLKDVVVQNSSNLDNTTMSGVKRISAKDLEGQPILGGERDIYKYIQLLPGVNNAAEGSAGLNVRGGAEDQNLVLINDTPVLGTTQLFGMLSPINPSIINTVDFYRDIFPVDNGNRVSSIIDIKTKKPNLNRFMASTELGILTNKLNISSPIIRNKIGVSFNTRLNNFNLLRGIAKNVSDRIPDYQFQDFFTELFAVVNKSTTLNAHFFRTQENWIDLPSSKIEKDFSTNFYQQKPYNSNFSLKLNKQVNSRLFFEVSAKKSSYEFNTLRKLNQNQNEFQSHQFSNRIEETSAKFHLNYVNNKIGIFESGFHATRLLNTPAKLSYSSQQFSTIIRQEDVSMDNFTLYSGFKKENIHNVSIFSGVRVNMIPKFKKVYFEPRLNVTYDTKNNLKIRAGFQQAYQSIQVATNPGLGPNESLWLLAERNEDLLNSQSMSLTLSKDIGFQKDLFEIESSIYYRKYRGNINWLEGFSSSNFSIYNPSRKELVISESITKGETTAMGWEVYLRKNINNNTINFNYTYSKAIQNYDLINKGETFRANFDQPHNLSLLINSNLTTRLSLNASWIFNSGRPITLPIQIVYIPQTVLGQEIDRLNESATRASFIYSKRNQYRMKDNHRLDISIAYKVFYRFGTGSVNLNVFNLYNRKNPTYYAATFDQFNQSFKISSVSLFPLIVSIGTSFELL